MTDPSPRITEARGRSLRDATPTAALLRWLQDVGVPDRRLARLAGVARSHLHRLRSGRVRRVRRGTAQQVRRAAHLVGEARRC